MNVELSQQQTLLKNVGTFTGFEMVQLPRPERFIYIYSVAKRSYPVHSGALPNLTLRGRTDGERYCLCAEIPDPFHEAVEMVESGRRRPEYTPGILVAMDAVNPSNITGNQDLDTSNQEWGEGQNLNERGVFWSLNYPPLESEIQAAEARVQRYKQKLADTVIQVNRSDPKRLHEFLTADAREALDDLGIETDFHKRPQVKIPCPNCAEMIPARAMFHRSELLGGICVRPTAEGWRSAVAAGFKKDNQIPDEFRRTEGV